MRFGIREICDCVFKAKADVKIGNTTFRKGQPVLYIDTAKTSTIEGAATTVYAQGGKGNVRLIAWEGEKTLTFTVEDALLSPIGFSVLSGAGLIKGKTDDEKVHVHTTTNALLTYSETGGTVTAEIDLSDAIDANSTICTTAPIFITKVEEDGSITGEMYRVKNASGTPIAITNNKLTIETDEDAVGEGYSVPTGQTAVLVDYYVIKKGSTISELQIDAENFAGYYYVEASTLFRRQSDGVDMPAEITFPNVKIQSNFTFTMAATGDPSTFTFTMDAFPGYTYFNPNKKVLCVIQIIEDSSAADVTQKTVMGHTEDEKLDTISTYEKDSKTYTTIESYYDSYRADDAEVTSGDGSGG